MGLKFFLGGLGILAISYMLIDLGKRMEREDNLKETLILMEQARVAQSASDEATARITQAFYETLTQIEVKDAQLQAELQNMPIMSVCNDPYLPDPVSYFMYKISGSTHLPSASHSEHSLKERDKITFSGVLRYAQALKKEEEGCKTRRNALIDIVVKFQNNN